MQSKISLLDNLNAKNVDLDEEIVKMKKELQSQVDEKGEIEKRICMLQSAHEKERSELEERIKSLQGAKELLLNSKIGLQNELEDANSRTNILKQEIEKVKGQSRKAEDKLQSELSHTKTELVSILV